MIYCGIDPGLTGAVVALTANGKVIGVWDTPVLEFEKTVKGKPKRRHEPNRIAMIMILKTIKSLEGEFGEIRAAIEDVHSMPEQGVASAFAFGMGFGMWLMALTALDISHLKVPPQRWKGQLMSGMGKQKDASRILAQQIWGSQLDLSRVKDHGRADAALIAEYRRRMG